VIVDLLELGVLGRELVVELVRRLPRRRQHVAWIGLSCVPAATRRRSACGLRLS
jgi:hypothetical protein